MKWVLWRTSWREILQTPDRQIKRRLNKSLPRSMINASTRLILASLSMVVLAFITCQCCASSQVRPENQSAAQGEAGIPPFRSKESSQENSGPKAIKHTVKLTWTASAPATKSPGDAVTSYKIYRSTSMPVQPIQQNMITCEFISATSCLDKNVDNGVTYNYIATGIAGSGSRSKESLASKPVSATIP